VGLAAALTAVAGPAQEDRERRLGERAHQDRDIVYFLLQPETHAFELYHDYTERDPGVDRYVNVVRPGSRVSHPSAVILDTGTALEVRTLRGAEITAAGIDIGDAVSDDSVVVVFPFTAPVAGGSVRLRITETYTDPGRYYEKGGELVWDRSFERAQNAIVLPEGWYLTNCSIPATISETEDGRIRLDFVNPRPDAIDVLLTARRRGG
jgi:hypothetical protein